MTLTTGIDDVYAYSHYGEVATLGPDGGNSLQYTGRENDGTGLYYYRARYYDPVLKRFVSEDPIGTKAGPNFYAYVMGQPTRFVDPFGLDATIWRNSATGRPSNGNWGGRCWGGGQESCGPKESGNAPRTDSGDACYMRHDNCWDGCKGNAGCMAICDARTSEELRALSKDSGQWPQPPRPGTEGDSERFRDGAIWLFSPPSPPPPTGMSEIMVP